MSEAVDKHRVLREVFGFDTFRHGQETVIDTIIAGGDALAVMPTGSGKSLCFQVPSLILGGLTIVVSPLLALMQDQVTALKLAGVAADTINSGRDRAANVAVWRQAAAGELRLLYLSPERLMTDRMLAALARLKLSMIAIDEAHCISQWGPSFRPDYQALAGLKERFPGTPMVALTATADTVTRIDILGQLFDGRAAQIVTGFDRPNIYLAASPKRTWRDQVTRFVEARKDRSGIVYCLSRAKTEEVADLLNQKGIPAMAYHAGMDRRRRSENQHRFVQEPGLVMVATIAFGMGIDKPDVRYVFHTDLPGSLEAYYQEIGRAGRDGDPAEAHMLHGLEDIRMRRGFIEEQDTASDHRNREHKRLDALLGYCESPICRRQVLLRYFGEEAEACGHCDVCTDPPVLADGTAAAHQVIAAVEATGRRFGPAHIIDLLRGADTEKMRSYNHHRLAPFGSGRELTAQAWRGLIRQMVAADLLRLDIQAFGSLIPGSHLAAARDPGWRFAYREEASGRRPKRTSTAKPKPVEAELSADDAALLDRLKQRRRDLAQERGVPAYVIFPDRSLREMAHRRPVDERDFGSIHGVGARKLEEFAADFLNIINR